MEKVKQNVKELNIAVSKGDVKKIEELIKKGVDVNARDQGGFTALYGAVFKGKIESVKALIKGGIEVNARDCEGCTALHYASMTEDGIVVELIKSGADTNARDSCGNIPLHEAVAMGKEKNVKALISGGADVNIENNIGLEAKDIADIRKFENIVEVLKNMEKKC
ncbi:MAG: ankyrin repeat domain-containing protein [Wolbachia endosymbiont of Tyrophagus putrescentiae]|nr:ankyrin repeat domain-containing protein [Wolbachia endosymbiont of Tyrophagus putrescentiae]